jgi:hypothetical protein
MLARATPRIDFMMQADAGGYLSASIVGANARF